eukprot:4457944-Prymnesium_polylepis.1
MGGSAASGGSCQFGAVWRAAAAPPAMGSSSHGGAGYHGGHTARTHAESHGAARGGGAAERPAHAHREGGREGGRDEGGGLGEQLARFGQARAADPRTRRSSCDQTRARAAPFWFSADCTARSLCSAAHNAHADSSRARPLHAVCPPPTRARAPASQTTASQLPLLHPLALSGALLSRVCRNTASHNIPQHAATRHNTPQHAAARRSTPQHAARAPSHGAQRADTLRAERRPATLRLERSYVQLCAALHATRAERAACELSHGEIPHGERSH